MDLEKILNEHQTTERSSPTVAYLTKPIWNQPYFEYKLNKLPEDILMKWLLEFLMCLVLGKKIPCQFSGNTTLGVKTWPLQFEVSHTSIEVSFITTDIHGTSKIHLFLIIDGPASSISKFKKHWINDSKEKFGLYSPKENYFLTREIAQQSS